MKKKILYALLGTLIVIQFVPSGRPDNKPVSGSDIHEQMNVPGDVSTILTNACYDCHSQKVNYPWYASVAPVSFLVSSDVREGRENLDFSLWEKIPLKKKLKVLTEIGEEVEEGDMPLPVYPFLHPEAKLSQEDRELILNWTKQASEELLD
ncbi:MAG: heme-binding domain-containing protein [Chlorobi bacterium]|nr:heme-binding domain-containing protein [Chlorobiota bacterium]